MNLIKFKNGVQIIKYNLFIFFLLININFVHNHVALTFPRARSPDLDFLDNERTKAPCGVPKGASATSLPAGVKFNVSWHLAYPHRGGFRIELLDPSEQKILDLTPISPESNFIGDEDSTIQSYPISLPSDLVCRGCTLRLIRQAKEWGHRYTFWSCADVDIIKIKNIVTDRKSVCTGNGQLNFKDGKCDCDHLYSGVICQYKDECWTDSDCGQNGKCVYIDAISYPKKQCFCKAGWFGDKCSKKSVIATPYVDLSHHSHRKLTNGFDLFWKIIKPLQEIEVILKLKGKSYGALGWRPQNINSKCKNFPLIVDSTSSREFNPISPRFEHAAFNDFKHSDANPQHSKSEAESNIKPSLKPTSNSRELTSHFRHHSKPNKKLDIQPFAELKAELKDESTTKPSTDSNALYNTKPIAEPEYGLDNIAEASDIFINGPELSTLYSEQSSQATAKAEPSLLVGKGNYEPADLNSEIFPKVAHNFRFKRNIANDKIPVPELEPKSTSAEKWTDENYPTHSQFTPKADFHSMDCTDIVIGVAHGDYGRVFDYYTRDRSTPRVDSFYGGKDDLTAALAVEKENLTTIIFRKKLLANELSDHSIGDFLMDVIWAKGQEKGNYVHSPASGLETGKALVKDFYREDEIKYHGNNNQRGKLALNFFEQKLQPSNRDSEKEKNCIGIYKYPANCAAQTCEYILNWNYVEEREEVQFSVSTRRLDRWTGVGFSENTLMSKTDVVLAWVESGGRYVMMDAWLEGYSQPRPDLKQSIYNISAIANQGLISFKFSRQMISDDKRHDISFDKCIYFVYPIGGGSVDTTNRNVWKHIETPIISNEKICFFKCSKLFNTSKDKTNVESNSEPKLKLQHKPEPKPESESESEPESEVEPEPGLNYEHKHDPHNPFHPNSKPETKLQPEPQPEPKPETQLEPQPEPQPEPQSESQPKPQLKPHSENQPETNQFGTNCLGEWKYPPKCIGYGCDYQVIWEYNDERDDIMFTISTKNRNKWTGIGFSADKLMSETDAILGLVEENGRFFLMDTWLENYLAPPLDQNQDIKNMSAWREDGITKLKFYRKRKTNDVKDFQFSDDNCPYLMFPIQGGVFNAVNKRIRKHETLPIVSNTRVCIKSCKTKAPSHDILNEAGVDNSNEGEISNKEPVLEPENEPEPKPEIRLKEDKSSNENDNDEKDKRKDEDKTNMSFGDEEDHDNDHDHNDQDIDNDHNYHHHIYHDNDDLDEDSSKPAYPHGKRTDMISILKSKKNDGKGDDNSVEVEFKLSNVWRSSLNEKNSLEYKKIMNNVQKQFENELSKRKQTDNKIELKNLTKSENNGALVTIKLDLINSTKLKSKASRNIALSQVKKAIKEAINSGHVGNLKVDPSYLIFNSPVTDLVKNEDEFNKASLSDEELKWLIIVIGVSFLIILFIIQAVCMVWRDNKNRRRNTLKDKQLVNPPYKDFSTATTNSAYHYENFGINDYPEGFSYKAPMYKLNGKPEAKKKLHKTNSAYVENTFIGNSDRPSESKTTSFRYPSSYGTHDRKVNHSHLLEQSKKYFLPYQRRYSDGTYNAYT